MKLFAVFSTCCCTFFALQGAAVACDKNLSLDSKRKLQGNNGERFRIGSSEWESFQTFQDSGARCGTVQLSDDAIEGDRSRVQQLIESHKRFPNQTRRLSTVNIDVYWHVIKNSNGSGALSENQIADSIAVVNAAYAPAGFQFTLVGTTETVRNAWFGAEIFTFDESQMKRALRRGNEATLNVYSLSPGDELLGWATFPSERAGFLDGVVILYETVPEGSAFPYNEGDTLTHEVRANFIINRKSN